MSVIKMASPEIAVIRTYQKHKLNSLDKLFLIILS